jgi:hypothetical protein
MSGTDEYRMNYREMSILGPSTRHKLGASDQRVTID